MAYYPKSRTWVPGPFRQNVHRPGFSLVRSRHPTDSGVCVAAMLAGTNYVLARRAALEARAWSGGRPMTSEGLRRTLERLGLHPDPRGLLRLPKRDPRRAPAGCALALVDGPEKHEKLWVAWDGYHVLDPCNPFGGRETGAALFWRTLRQKHRRPATYLHVPDARNVVS